MFEKVGNWYVFSGKKMFKIHKKHVDENKIAVMKINEKFFYSRTYTLEFIDINSIANVSKKGPYSDVFIKFISGEELCYDIDYLQHMDKDKYEDMVEMEKLKKQVKELSDYVYSPKTLNDLV